MTHISLEVGRNLTNAIPDSGAAGWVQPAGLTAAPVFGQHSDEVLGEYGYSAEEIAGLRNRSVVL